MSKASILGVMKCETVGNVLATRDHVFPYPWALLGLSQVLGAFVGDSACCAQITFLTRGVSASTPKVAALVPLGCCSVGYVS